MEGVERNKVRLIQNNLKWKYEFLQTKNELEEIWGENIIDIQHVGSTAITAIYAKPILDIAIKLKSISDMNIELLKQQGYSYCGSKFGNLKYHLFVLRGDREISLRHIHCYDKEEKEFKLLVGFRDYLNDHCDEAKKYELLKLELSKRYPDDRVAYTNGKEEFIKSIYSKLYI
ncbi:MAG: GrpB family protein [Clostridium sp.]|uniref:GrpB family protein n=1 Tax=Clostridium sp. TaxID=1506 RepID=UPI002FC6BB42